MIGAKSKEGGEIRAEVILSRERASMFSYYEIHKYCPFLSVFMLLLPALVF